MNLLHTTLATTVTYYRHLNKSSIDLYSVSTIGLNHRYNNTCFAL